MKPKEKPKRRSVGELLESVDFAPENVVAAAATNSVLFADAIQFRLECLEKHNAAKAAWERTQAEYELALRREARANDEKITEGNIKALCLVDKKVSAAREAYDTAEELAEYSKLFVDIFRMRRDCLQIVKDLVRNEISIQAAVESGRENLEKSRRAMRERFPEE